MLRSMNAFRGFRIDATDSDIGRVDAFYFDDTTFTVRHLVVDGEPRRRPPRTRSTSRA